MNDIATDLLGQRVSYYRSHGPQAFATVRAVYATGTDVALLVETDQHALERISASAVRVER